jgi:probable F420-dependent oxidoreductase
MELGFASMNTPEDVPVATLAVELEARGFTSLWMGEHSHIPVDRRTPYPAGGDMPEQYRRMMDPFPSLLVAAGATEKLRVGTGVALPLEHDVFALAKTVATVDRLSGGRFDFGVGVGWNVEELAGSRPDVPWASRYRALEDCVGALVALWTHEEAAHHGRWFDFDAVWCEPKPLQTPHPPIVCGMSGRLGTAHAVAWADEWMPVDIGLGDVEKKVGLFRAAVAAAGRADIAITMVAWGDPTPDALHRYRDLGVRRVVLGPGRERWHDPASTIPFLDRYAAVVAELAA